MSRGAAEFPVKWPWLFHGFRWYAPRYLLKRFTAVRLASASAPWPADRAPVLVVLNHPSWHDPVTATLLSFAFPTDAQYAVIEAKMLKSNAVLSKIGFLPVDSNTLAGAATFLRVGRDLLSRDDHVLWVTAQGRFADSRERPLAIKTGVGHLAKTMRRGWVLPVALEYPFWDAPKPEALALVGRPLAAGDASLTGKAWAARIEAALTAASDQLAELSLTRDPSRFVTLAGDSARPAGGADLRRRMRAAFRGRSWQPSTPVLPAVPS